MGVPGDLGETDTYALPEVESGGGSIQWSRSFTHLKDVLKKTGLETKEFYL